MAKFMGRDIPSITVRVQDITYIPDYHKHSCTGKADYEFADVTILDGKRKNRKTLIMCKTCGKVFSADNPYSKQKYVKIDTTEVYEKERIKEERKKERRLLAEKQAEEARLRKLAKQAKATMEVPQKGESIFFIDAGMHRCTGTPELVTGSVKLFKENKGFKLTYCKSCKKYFHTGERMLFSSYNKANGGYYDLHLSEDSRNESQEMVTAEVIEPHNFLIITSTRRCASKGHDLQDINARIRILTKTGKIMEVITPAIYCSSCKRYFLLEQDYERVLKYGTPICRTITIESYIKIRDGKLQYNDESLLHSLGYNVNAQEGLTDRERQRILSIVIDEGAMHKSEVLSFLDYLIRRSTSNPRLENARGKWSRDRQFVSQYKRTPRQNVEVESITIRKYKHK